MGYFNELPELQILNRTKNQISNDETLIIKNFFKRAKLRDDIASVASAFEYYMITEGERPEEVAEKVYGDPELDWVILTTNNITDVQNEWPLNIDSLNKYMLDKYGSEEAYTDIHHYETISLKDSFGREVFPGGLIVDEAFYNSPSYETVTDPPLGVTFPSIYIPGTQAELVPVVSGIANSITNVQIVTGGLGYQKVPTVNISPPPVTANASASPEITDFRVSGIATLNGGQGFNFPPQVSFSDPIESVQATASCELGTGIEIDQVTTTSVSEGGIGYGLTAPTVTFGYSPRVVFGVYNNQSNNAVGNDVEGFYFREDGTKLYTASFTGSNQIKQYDLSDGWKVSTTSLTYELDVSGDFGFTTGIEFKPDGKLMYVTGGTGSSYKIVTYDLGTAWDLSTASSSNSITIASPGGIRLKSDGTSMFVLDFTNPDAIKEYSLSSAWDITSRSGSTIRTVTLSNPSGDNAILGFNFNPDGTKLFATSEGTSSIYEFDMDAWEIDTAVYSYSFYVGDRVQAPSDIFIKPDREKFVTAGGSSDKFFEYVITSTTKGVTQITNGSVSGIVITNPGLGYTEAPTVTIGSPYPRETAEGTASITAGIVTSINITKPGFGYTTPPTITIADAPISRNAVISVTLSNTGISTFTIFDGGSNYVNSPTIRLDAPDDILNVEDNEEYSQDVRTWRWNGTVWQEKTADEFQYFDPTSGIILKVPGRTLSKPITNYEYESTLNDEKRRLYILKPNYLSTIITDLRNMMTYDDEDPNYINDKLKKTYNERIMGI
jgi:hypothetical protein